MLEPANPVRAPVNDVLFKHIGPNAKRKTAFRARRTINQNTGIDGRTDANPRWLIIFSLLTGRSTRLID